MSLSLGFCPFYDLLMTLVSERFAFSLMLGFL